MFFETRTSVTSHCSRIGVTFGVPALAPPNGSAYANPKLTRSRAGRTAGVHRRYNPYPQILRIRLRHHALQPHTLCPETRKFPTACESPKFRRFNLIGGRSSARISSRNHWGNRERMGVTQVIRQATVAGAGKLIPEGTPKTKERHGVCSPEAVFRVLFARCKIPDALEFLQVINVILN